MQHSASPPRLPPRDPRGHKGTFGTVAVIGGCVHRPDERGIGGSYMLGGPALAAVAALRSGAGLARLALPEPILAAALAVAPSATGIPLSVDPRGDIVPHLAAAEIDHLLAGVDCLAIGPGLGISPGAAAMTLRCLVQDTVPVVADADALNNLAAMPEFHRDFRAAAVLTPHVGECRRLGAAMGVAADPASQPEEAAADLARKLGCIIVLKSAATIITDGHDSWRHDSPNPALATAGTGDVLTGVIAGLIAQHARPPGGLSLYECARAGVAAHAAAARAWSEHHSASGGLLAAELVEEIPAAVEGLRKS